MSDFSVEKYKLSSGRNRQIFEKEIIPDLLEGNFPQENPTALFLISQPGSGKSRLQKEFDGLLNRKGGYIDLDSDLYKPYHDSYDELMQRDDKLMAAGTRADGREWMRQAAEYARERHINVIVQDTAQDPSHSEQMMEDYREAGYRVETVLMAVPKEISDQGIKARYYEQVIDRGMGRLTVQDAADQSYMGVAGVAQLVDERPDLIDRAQLFRRGENVPCYDTADNRWDDASLAETLAFEREERPWTPEMVASFREMQGNMRDEQGPEVAAKLGPQWQATITDLDQRAAPKIVASEAAGGLQRDSQRMAGFDVTKESNSKSKEAGGNESVTATASERIHVDKDEKVSQQNAGGGVQNISENMHDESFADSDTGRRTRGNEGHGVDVDVGQPRRKAEDKVGDQAPIEGEADAQGNEGRTGRARESADEAGDEGHAAGHGAEDARRHNSSTRSADDQQRHKEAHESTRSQGQDRAQAKGDDTIERLRQARHARRREENDGDGASRESARDDEGRDEPER